MRIGERHWATGGRLNTASIVIRSVLTVLGVCVFRFQHAYLGFFEGELAKNGHDWKKVAIDYMMNEPRPLLHGAACGGKSVFFVLGRK